MSDERGSIKMSTANDIGTSLVTVLGGDGYSPEEWADNINLCGIHAADIENALENIEDSTGSGSERGSFLVSIANKIGAVLNKKYNTSRGFKPKEWASAISFLEPLPERTASGAVASITDGADKVPVKSWGISIPANLDGVNTLECYQGGKNFLPNDLTSQELNGTTFTVNADKSITISGTPSAQTRVYITRANINIKTGMYFSSGNMPTGTRIFCSKTSGGSTTYPTISPSHSATVGANYTNFLLEINTTYDGTEFTIYPQLEVGSSATTYEPYTAPTVSEVDLGRTVYGADVDVISGEGKTKVYKQTFTGDNVSSVSLSYGQADTGYTHLYFYTSGIPVAYSPSSANVVTDIGVPMSAQASQSAIPAMGECFNLINTGSGANQRPTIYWYTNQTWTDINAFKTWLNANPITVVYEVTEEETFNFDPIDPIPETEETYNLWSDVGDSTVVYRADIDSPEPNNLLGLNNSLGNSNNNTEEEVI